MAVDEAGDEIAPGPIDDLGVRSRAFGNQAAVDRDIPCLGEALAVEDADVAQDRRHA